MSCFLFGKLPAKRDFVAIGMPRELLRFWETWLQGGMSASQHSLGGDWRELYLHAPIWRFWLGRAHLGHEVMGAFMPSLDGVGRYFPLAVMAQAAEGEAFAAPGDDDQSSWFDAIETFLLDTLEPGSDYEATQAALAALPRPVAITRDEAGEPAVSNLIGVADPQPEPQMPRLFARLEDAERVARRHAGSFWWTIGGEALPALALKATSVPQAQDFALFLKAGMQQAASEPAATEAAPESIEAEVQG